MQVTLKMALNFSALQLHKTLFYGIISSTVVAQLVLTPGSILVGKTFTAIVYHWA